MLYLDLSEVVNIRKIIVTAKGLTCPNCSQKINDKLVASKKFKDVSIDNINEEILFELFEDRNLNYEEQKFIKVTVDQIEKGVTLSFNEAPVFKANLPEGKDITVSVKGLTCANCSKKIEDRLNESNYFKNVIVNPLNEEIYITTKDKPYLSDEDKKFIKNTVDTIESGVTTTFKENDDLKNEITSTDEKLDEESERSNKGVKSFIENNFDLIREVMAIGLFIISIFTWENTEVVLLIVAFLLAGYEVLLKAFKNLMRGSIFDENFLMTIASIGAFLLGDIREAAGIMIFYGLGELLQEMALNKSKKDIKKLMDISTKTATLLVGEEERVVDVNTIRLGDELVVKPGDKIPVDSEIISGFSSLDMKAINGESVPKDVKQGDIIPSGSINLSGRLVLKANKVYGDSTASRIMELVKASSKNKADTEKFITRFSRIYTPVVVGLALITAFIVPLILKEQFTPWIHKALIFLVISCPCALLMSIPLGFFGGIGLASKNGILVKGANYLDNMRFVRTIFFDKTGTITTGKLRISKVSSKIVSEEELLKIVYQLEKNSLHPIAKSVVGHFKLNSNTPKGDLGNIKDHPGLGIQGEDEKYLIFVGNDKMMDGLNLRVENTIGTSLHVARVNKETKEGVYLGNITFEDTIKAEAKESIQALKDLNVNNLIILSGDRIDAVKNVAKETQVTDFKAQLLPEDKVREVQKFISNIKDNGEPTRKQKNLVAFVGDGINDTPVLATSDVGISMGNLGSDAAVEFSDIVITDDNLRKLPVLIKISRETYKTVLQNIIFSITIKILVLVLSFFGVVNIWLAIFADVGVALIAILNSARLIFKEIK